MAQRFAKSWVRSCVNISPEFYRLCKEHRIKFSEALRVGISLMLAEKGVSEYDNRLNITRKLAKMTLKIEELSLELDKLTPKDPISTTLKHPRARNKQTSRSEDISERGLNLPSEEIRERGLASEN